MIKNFHFRRSLCAAIVGLSFGIATASGGAEHEILLTIKDHRFYPADLKVPANQKIKLMIHNRDATTEEFESHKLNREKLIPPGAKTLIYIGPLKPGR
ncbi:MAG: cupredoxin domain-containing protein [Betaproteobacteria bacterium]|nr:cupredoxin domain-containing protein [Betaproteobacteria bacterium]